MSSAFIIEVHSHAAGIVVRDGSVFRFHAAAPDFNGLDGRAFRSPGEAHKAALLHLAVRASDRRARAFRRGPAAEGRPENGRPAEVEPAAVA